MDPFVLAMQFQIIFKPFYAIKGYFHPKYKDSKVFDNHLNPVMLVFIELLSLSTQMSTHLLGFQSFSAFLHHFVLAKLASSSLRVKKWIPFKGDMILSHLLKNWISSLRKS